eukprot:CAMPEP_0201118894 /NCGR_PEP_ID=MMETSP0850-20130426/3093_1 /ASSEMBLY_ACC=CAM_ASM_000622 /TAXON_ID=183588 /ORGANISM="Pseudo-nitzschia fraudulenta, Strain WWA7" /LENGTH=163 /DNA_ID=CAMNT_0047384383 /DNA_START=122 /DNA_END=613 /DNA_ORIENTATION=-
MWHSSLEMIPHDRLALSRMNTPFELLHEQRRLHTSGQASFIFVPVTESVILHRFSGLRAAHVQCLCLMPSSRNLSSLTQRDSEEGAKVGLPVGDSVGTFEAQSGSQDPWQCEPADREVLLSTRAHRLWTLLGFLATHSQLRRLWPFRKKSGSSKQAVVGLVDG